ncbi:hypothetical protein BDW22DRAFT_1355094 [Trametopsis cervina]|nr:hypothetical protein BDW22DRAFT_1355094 [Trametopsis cervina]
MHARDWIASSTQRTTLSQDYTACSSKFNYIPVTCALSRAHRLAPTRPLTPVRHPMQDASQVATSIWLPVLSAARWRKTPHTVKSH